MIPDFTNIKIPYRSVEEIKNIADNFRNIYWKQGIPIDIELIVENGLQLKMGCINGLKRLINTDAFLTGDLTEIIYDPDVFSFRVRFSIAHEVGHFIMHAEQVKLLRTTDFLDWQQTIEDIPGPLWGRAEQQANEFAACLLMPIEFIETELRNMKKVIQEAKDYNLDKDSLCELLAADLSKRFEVSNMTMKYRLSKLEINPYDYL
jgi:Zn-dependent peptidase ImmA (M78 family)